MRGTGAIAAVGAWLVAGSLLAGCGLLQHPPKIVDPTGGNWAIEGQPSVHQSDLLSIGMETTLCLDKAGTVQLSSITPILSVGIRVVGFGLRPNQTWKPTQGIPGQFLGVESAPLAQFGFTGRHVDAMCDQKTGAGYELAVRVEKTLAGPARASGWKITYASHGHAKAVIVPLGINLCPDDAITPQRCPDPDMSHP